MRIKSLKNQIGDSFPEARLERGTFTFAAQGFFDGADFEEFGGDLPHASQISGRGPVADLAVILMIGNLENVMTLVLPAVVSAALRLH